MSAFSRKWDVRPLADGGWDIEAPTRSLFSLLTTGLDAGGRISSVPFLFLLINIEQLANNSQMDRSVSCCLIMASWPLISLMSLCKMEIIPHWVVVTNKGGNICEAFSAEHAVRATSSCFYYGVITSLITSLARL